MKRIVTVTRSLDFTDVTVTGRTVTAYAAVFNQPTEINDQDGHYEEQLAPTAFERTLAHRGLNFQVLANHGKTLYGTPSERFSSPCAVLRSIRPDGFGLITEAEYLDTELGNEQLVGINAGAIRGYSWSGRCVRSTPVAPRGGYMRSASGLTLVTREEIALIELGPTSFPAYEGAGIVGVRASMLEDTDRIMLEAILEKLVLADLALDPLVAALCANDDALDASISVLASILGDANPDQDDAMPDSMDRAAFAKLTALSTRLAEIKAGASTPTTGPAATGDPADLGHSRPATTLRAHQVRALAYKMGVLS